MGTRTGRIYWRDDDLGSALELLNASRDKHLKQMAVPPTPAQLIKRPTEIAGYEVDFPLGLPASVLTANAKWIEFYARRGFDILTYKTVRSRKQGPHPWPHWVFLKDPEELCYPFTDNLTGDPGYWPDDSASISMANSFGIPSEDPLWWKEDVRRARGIVREGHQVLIVSIVASVCDTFGAITEDFAKTAFTAKQAGADIIEANYSCPNTPGDPAGQLYQDPEKCRRVSEAIKEAVSGSPKAPALFVKIGYLQEGELRKFVELNQEFIDGVVAINTIPANIVNLYGKPVFPRNAREKAGVSGWAIGARAREVARNLVVIRNEIYSKSGKKLTILGLGGVLKRQDAFEYLDKIGVDAVESCTGAFVNPYLGLEIRAERQEI